MRQLYLNVYGIKINILCNSSFPFENLKKDFVNYMYEKTEGKFDVLIHVYYGKVPYGKVPPLVAKLYNIGSTCYRNKDVHYIDYAGKGLMIYDFGKEQGEIYSEDENLLYEKARLAILSRIGELLDRRHIHRLHAAGFSSNNRAVLCLLPMEAGKTTLTLNILKKDNNIRLLSDDVCFIDYRFNVYPFMLRVGVRDMDLLEGIPAECITKINRQLYGEKYLIDISYFQDRVATENKAKVMLIGKKVFKEDTEIIKISKLKCFLPFVQSGVFGLGLPQIIELFLRGDVYDFISKISILMSRAILFLLLLCRTKTYELRLGRNAGNSAVEIINFINCNCK